MTEQNQTPEEDKQPVSDFLSDIANSFGKVEEKIAKRYEDLRGDQGLKDNAERAKDSFKEKTEKVSESAKDAYDKLPDEFTNGLEKTAEVVGSFFNKAFDTAGDFLSALKEEAEEEFDRRFADHDSENLNGDMGNGAWGECFTVCDEGCCEENCGDCTDDCKRSRCDKNQKVFVEKEEVPANENTTPEYKDVEKESTVDMRDIVDQSMRLNPENIIVGEVSNETAIGFTTIDEKIISLYQELASIPDMPGTEMYKAAILKDIEDLRQQKRNN